MRGIDMIKLLCQAALIDDELDDAERAALDALAAEHGVGTAALDQIIQQVQRREQMAIDLPKKSEEKRALLTAAIEMVAADRKVVKTERFLLNRLARLLGISEDEVRHMTTSVLQRLEDEDRARKS